MTHTDADRIRALASTTRASGLAQLTREARIDAVLKLKAELLQLAQLGDVALLSTSSGLSPAMTRWCLRTTLESITRAGMEACLDDMHRPGHRTIPLGLLGVVLSGNVLTAPTRALLLPLLLGVPVVARVSSREREFAVTLAEVLSSGCPSMQALGRGLALVHFDHDASDGAASLSALLESVDGVSVYGSDETCAELARKAPMGVPVTQHGHGLGVGVLSSAANQHEASARAALSGFALDVAAYDQRGCLSPQVLYVQENGWVSPEGAAALLHEALGELQACLPRGPLDAASGARQAQFRGVGVVLGTVWEGAGWAVSYEGTQPVRSSPGFRNIAVHSYGSEAELLGRLQPLGRHLKVVGLAGDDSARGRFVDALPVALASRVCAPGQMQTPAFAGMWDGLPPWHGLLRYVAR